MVREWRIAVVRGGMIEPALDLGLVAVAGLAAKLEPALPVMAMVARAAAELVGEA
jgi:hypothetical protein